MLCNESFESIIKVRKIKKEAENMGQNQASGIKAAMANAHKAKVSVFGNSISEQEYKELRVYADAHGIRISGFRNYVGEIETIKRVIDDINEIGQDFPKILDEKTGVVLELDFDMSDDDFATTDSGHVIHLNATFFCDTDRLKAEYDSAVKEGNFVEGTDWRATGRHEAGHVVQNFYRFDVLKIATLCTGTGNHTELFELLRDELSIYSVAYKDGREIISESFSGYYSKVGNIVADAFVNKCISDKNA